MADLNPPTKPKKRRFSVEFCENSTEEERHAIEEYESTQTEFILTESQLAELQSTFHLFDKDGSGNISVSELQSVMTTLGHPQTSDEMHEIMAAIDKDGSGEIDFSEFLPLMAPRMCELEAGLEQAMLEVFKSLDKDGNGYLEANEVQQIMTQLGDPISFDEATAMVKEADLDGDGRIMFNELLKIMNHG